MNVELLSITDNAEKLIEKCGRTCYNSIATENSSDKFIQNIIKQGHLTVIENGVATFNIQGISRICSHQLVRSRIAVFSQKSERYCEESRFKFIIPDSIHMDTECYYDYITVLEAAQKAYNKFLSKGFKKEDCRFIIPQCVETEINMTMNFRNLLHTIDLRVSLKAQWEIRNLFIEIWKQLYKLCPNVFGLTYFENWSKDYKYKKEIFETKIA